ncbi:MAG: hypothetical protein ABIQ58_10515 [Candidatus Limnocylindrales bacterium]
MTAPPADALGSAELDGPSDGAVLGSAEIVGAELAGAVVAPLLLQAVNTIAAAAVRRMGRNFTGWIS